MYPGCYDLSKEVDHIVPGNNHGYDNLQGLCSNHHGKKSSQEGHRKKAKLRKLRSRPAERHPGYSLKG